MKNGKGQIWVSGRQRPLPAEFQNFATLLPGILASEKIHYWTLTDGILFTCFRMIHSKNSSPSSMNAFSPKFQSTSKMCQICLWSKLITFKIHFKLMEHACENKK